MPDVAHAETYNTNSAILPADSNSSQLGLLGTPADYS